MSRRSNFDRLVKIDERIGVCMKNIMFLRSDAEASVNFRALLVALKSVEDKEMGEDVQVLRGICDIILGKNYAFERDGSVEYIKIKDKVNGEYENFKSCVIRAQRNNSENRHSNTANSPAAIIIKLKDDSNQTFEFESLCDFMRILCIIFYPDSDEKKYFISELSRHCQESTENRKRTLEEKRRRKKEEEMILNKEFKNQLESLAALDILKNSVQQLLNKEIFQGKIKKEECILLLLDKINKLMKL